MAADTRHAGPWLVARYAPVSLFSLKASFATSSVATTLVLPTPYAIKMALVDAGFRAGRSDAACSELLAGLVDVPVRIAPPEAVVTHTFCKIRQEPKTQDPLRPYISNIAYREFVFHDGEWRWALGMDREDAICSLVIELLAHVHYIGKRGSFVQYLGCEWQPDLGAEYTIPVPAGGPLSVPPRCHVVPLDDLGPDASLDVLSSFSPAKARRDRHRVFVDTVVPLGRARAGPGFTEYRR